MLLPVRKEDSLHTAARMASSRETDETAKARAREAMAKEEVHPTRRNNKPTRTRGKRMLLQSNETQSLQKQRSQFTSLVVRYKTRSFQDHHFKKQVCLTLLLVMQFIVN